MPAKPSHAPFRLLFVDDEPGILNALKRVFRKEGYEINVASSGEEALRFLDAHPVDLILSDYNMPALNGLAFFAKVRERAPRTVRILLTGLGGAAEFDKAIEEGSISFALQKPWQDEQLREIVQKQLQNRS